ncbi:hypothetical protein DOT_1922, partial [Desulfosporosinus sp. OT]
VSFHTFALWDSVHILVTDSGLSASIKEELELKGVEVLLA